MHLGSSTTCNYAVEQSVQTCLAYNYDDPAAIALVREAETQFDGAKRAELYAKVQAIVAQDAPYIALDYPPNIYTWRPSLHGFTVNPGGAYRPEDVWLG